MPRMLRRAAVLGATAHVASSRGAAQASQGAAAAQAAQQQPVPPAPVAAPAPDADPYAELIKLKELLDAGILTQEEFDAKKTAFLAL